MEPQAHFLWNWLVSVAGLAMIAHVLYGLIRGHRARDRERSPDS